MYYLNWLIKLFFILLDFMIILALSWVVIYFFVISWLTPANICLYLSGNINLYYVVLFWPLLVAFCLVSKPD